MTSLVNQKQPPEVFYKKRCSKKFAKFTGKHSCQSLWDRCFPVKFAKFLRTLFLQNTSKRLLLDRSHQYILPEPNTEFEFGQRYDKSFTRVINLVSDAARRRSGGILQATPVGFRGKSPCKPGPRMVSNGVEACILIPFSSFINYCWLETA